MNTIGGLFPFPFPFPFSFSSVSFFDDDDGSGDDEETFRMSMGIEVPVNPRNWERADVRYVRVVRASRGEAVCCCSCLSLEWYRC